MAYLVKVSPGAENDLALLYAQINAAYSDAAMQWYLGIKAAILSLEQQPTRCAVIRKHARLRQLLYGHKPRIYRVIYRILEEEKLVQVLHIRHGARQDFKPSDLV